MNIGIIGAGRMGKALGAIWVQHHQLMLSYGRDQHRLQAAARELGPRVSVGTPAQAAQFGDVIVLTVRWSQVQDALAQAGPMIGKSLLSTIIPINAQATGLALGTTTSAAEEVARLVPEAHVVAAFFPVFASLLQTEDRSFHGMQADMLYCGDNEQAKTTTASLIREAGFTPLDGGELTSARLLEPLGFLWAELGLVQGLGSRIALKVLRQEEEITL